MLIKRLKLHNFIIFKDVDLCLEDVKLTTIIGSWKTNSRRSNGAGKSALLEAIPYALFGTTRSKQKMDIVRRGQKRCDVEIEFVANGRAIRIFRQRNVDGTSNAKMWVDGEPAASQVRAVDAAVKQYLGVDQNLFELIYFFRQDDQFGFVNASPGERKSHLARVFDLGGVEACLVAAKRRHADAAQAQERAIGAATALHETLGAMPPRAAMVDRVLDLYDALAHCQLKRQSREVYNANVPVDITEAKLLRDDYDTEVASAVEEHKALEGEFQSNLHLIARLTSEVGGNESALKAQRSALDDMSVETDLSKSIKQWDEELKVLEDEQYETMSKIARLDVSISSSRNTAIEIKELAGMDCPTCNQMVGVEHCEDILKSSANFVKENVETRASLGVKLAMLKQQCSNARKGKGLREKVEAVQLQSAKLQQGIDALATTVRQQREKLAELDVRQPKIRERQAILSHSVSATEATQVRLRINEIIHAHGSHLYDESFDEEGMASEAAKAEERLDRYEEITGRIADAEAAVTSARRAVSVWDYTTEAFGKNGLQAILIENVVSVIEQFANDILKQMQTQFELSLRTQKTIQTGEARETLDVVIIHNGGERMFETYSGGERTLINLALRLSLSRIISSLHGVVMQSLFLDEVLAALDEVNREEAIKVVAFLSKSFDQVFVISHTAEVKDIIPGQVLIERHEEHSEVVISNGRS